MAVDWITLADAKALTGNSALVDADLTTAEAEIFDEIRWHPVFGDDLTEETTEGVTLRADALGRAIAWQATYRKANVAGADDTSGNQVQSERIGDYAVTYGGQSGQGLVSTGGIIANRARKLLKQYGLYNMTGLSKTAARFKYVVANAADVLTDP